ncbi:hypothetical protein RISK_002280 [Rhodopirellula islandica]|uniref:Uncharacterized protein n=1 Tax=Rhodopirellula islandica TaxID=595434 RepID=A0A0J1BGH9_RHOIS|nr:hypothetical protein RISK_002280 [Rhodopirellula islandica]
MFCDGAGKQLSSLRDLGDFVSWACDLGLKTQGFRLLSLGDWWWMSG